MHQQNVPFGSYAARREAHHFAEVHVARRIKMRRLNQGLTIEDLGQALGLTRTAVEQIEAGTERLSAALLCRIANALDAPISSFFDGMA